MGLNKALKLRYKMLLYFSYISWNEYLLQWTNMQEEGI